MLVITKCDAVNIPWAFIAFLLWIGRNLPDFKSPKQALINAFYNMSANRLLGLRCKGTTFI